MTDTPELSNPIAMIAKGLREMARNRRASREQRMDLLARFEKRAAWVGEDWTYWDFTSAPDQLASLASENPSLREVDRRCRDWIARDGKSKSPLIRLIEGARGTGMADQVRALIDAGADPNAATLLKDVPLGFARDRGLDDVFDLLIDMGADGTKAGFSPLHHAARYGTLDDVVALIDSFDILWHHFDAPSVLFEAVMARRPDTVAVLLDYLAGEGRLAADEIATCCKTAASLGNAELVRPFVRLGVQPDLALDATLESFDVAMLRLLLDCGADVHQITDIALYHQDPLTVLDAAGQPAITAYVRTLLDAGWRVEDLEEFEHAQIRYVTEAHLIAPQDIDAPGFLDSADACAGNANPEERTTPYALEMLRTGLSPFAMRRRLPRLPFAAWTADRFGQSTTRLDDGRWVQIGGEHEDFYDPDFVIFSDVVVHGPNGEVRVYFYPASVFPPTDFHTATEVADAIWIIGGLGYMGDRREGVTMVHRLDLVDFSITRVATTGEAPGWISRHSASCEGTAITVSGGSVSLGRELTDLAGTFTLQTDTRTWTRTG